MPVFADQVDGEPARLAAIKLAGLSSNLFEAFEQVATSDPELPFLCIPARQGRSYHSDGIEISYGAALVEVTKRADGLTNAGYGSGHRIALMLDNRPEHFFTQLALYKIGATQVPINPDYLDHELKFLLAHSEVDLALGLAHNIDQLAKMANEVGTQVCLESDHGSIPEAEHSTRRRDPGRAGEAAIVYTSGTTGHPKGCIIDHEYHFQAGLAYVSLGGRLSLLLGADRIFVPLPVFHVNAGINTLTALILTRNCMILPDRFHPTTWWQDIVESRATAMHYLGVIPPILLNREPITLEKKHNLRFGLGAGLDPGIHQAFESRFDIPMVEVWGMTETGRFVGDCHEPRRTETRAFGKVEGDLEAKVVDEKGVEVQRNTPGELVVRSRTGSPRQGFFRGYLKDELSTETAWLDGWFHTGDVVKQEPDGMMHFIERRKNIIRRSGENISAAEVENALIIDPDVIAVAVLGVIDELRDEEVMACIIPQPGIDCTAGLAQSIFNKAREHLAYYKLPGWIVFVDDLPRTGTQKVQKGLIFPSLDDPRKACNATDLRALKKRGS